jgi:iron complex transport system substrate-binding protein
VRAVKNKRVYKMPTGISRWGHPGSLETPLAVLWTVKTVYPEYSSSINMKKDTLFFYKKFFGYTLPDETLEKILEGRGLRKSKRNGKK